MSAGIGDALKKCNIYFNECLISKESILEKYSYFFADAMDPQTRKVGFALHTGSICFDVVAVVAVAVGCLSYNLATNDDIIASLQPGDMVMYKGQRYRWRGVEQMGANLCLSLEQDGTGKNGTSRCWVPYEKNKHLILPYYGDSKKTDGRGVRRKITNREDFLSFIYGLPDSDIPTQIDASVVIVAERGTFADICKSITIEYGDGMRVGLLDVVPASYYTGNGVEYRFGSNPTKAEPVLKVTGNLSTARELVLDKHGNKVVGIVVSGNIIPSDGSAELSDLLRRKTLRFAFVTSPLRSGIGDNFLELYDDASFFACTKEYLSATKCEVKNSNNYTEELFRQTATIIQNTIHPIKISGGFSRDEYSAIRNLLLRLKQFEWDVDLKDEFIVTAQGILNLLNTAVFSMAEMEQAVAAGIINQTVQSPKTRVDYLWSIAEKAGPMQEVCMTVADAIEHQCDILTTGTPKAEALREIITQHNDSSVAIVVPKSYYADVLQFSRPELFALENVICVTANKFDPQTDYGAVIVVGEFGNRKFDVLNCVSSKDVYIFLYDCEEKVFTYRKRKHQEHEYEINERIGLTPEKPIHVPETDENVELEIQRFSSLDEYIDNYKLFDIRKLAVGSGQASGAIPTSEVTHIGVFSSEDQIFFSKYYSAVVFDAAKGTVVEKNPSDLMPGDVMVFAKRDDYTKNIVDTVYDRLLTSGKLSSQSVDKFEKSKYWKEALREYKEKNGLTYRDIARKMQELGSSLQEVSIRQWLFEDSHIVGPRDEKTMRYVALLTQDPFLLENVSDYHEACRYVRHERREILKLIAKAINDKLMGFTPAEGSVLGVVYENVEKLSETRELESVSELDESVYININLVNRPITESEVQL